LEIQIEKNNNKESEFLVCCFSNESLKYINVDVIKITYFKGLNIFFVP